MQNLTALMPPRSISEQFCVGGWTHSANDGDAIGLDHDNLDICGVYIDFDPDDPTYYIIAGHVLHSVEEVQELLNEIADNPEDFIDYL